ncbi:uncharacterized protein CTRU02_211921 [Colletotrichum truncatum]|uniref:Uncharacterized protein n=1 Tax=Colletotrichum truncatum TaxID=5467 RepID=A0ACC3YM19_COLTU|nr:uncharacterized protein CTRU02_07332 [Colletotrichum truncatum]KAF6791569.1 hypothetical protein CTRU02_07332 [Colletotrichum truncatum]
MARPMGASRCPEKATQRRHWAATPCLALIHIRGRLHLLGCWDSGA